MRFDPRDRQSIAPPGRGERRVGGVERRGFGGRIRRIVRDLFGVFVGSVFVGGHVERRVLGGIVRSGRGVGWIFGDLVRCGCIVGRFVRSRRLVGDVVERVFQWIFERVVDLVGWGRRVHDLHAGDVHCRELLPVLRRLP
jgi:hypothetical protein